jgi:hypothetical protein
VAGLNCPCGTFLNLFLSCLLLFRSATVRVQIGNLQKRQKVLEDLKRKGDDESDKKITKAHLNFGQTFTFPRQPPLTIAASFP